jgi:dipeptidase E
MKLFLSSGDIPSSLRENFLALVGKKVADIKFALIENAADPYPDDTKGWMFDTRKSFESLGMQVTFVDLRMHKEDPESLYLMLKEFDVVWIGGGNTYYMRWLMKVSGFDTIIKKLLDEGIVYGGGSAGAILPCPVLEKFDVVDDPNAAPEVIKQGLGLIDFVIVPHWGDPEYQSRLDEIKNYYDALKRCPVVTITDNQAVVVDGDSCEIHPI